MGKLGIALGAGVGYVLGARAGRARYDQIAQQARRLWSDPRVQKAKEQAGDAAQQAGSQAKDKVQEKVQDVTGDSTPSDARRPGTLEPTSEGQATPHDMPSAPATDPLHE